MDIGDAVRIAIPLVSAACVVFASEVARRAHRQALDTELRFEEASDLLVVAHDPGRDIHVRLASSLEAAMVRTGGSKRPDPATRRAAAMMAAAAVIEQVRAANLAIVPADTED